MVSSHANFICQFVEKEFDFLSFLHYRKYLCLLNVEIKNKNRVKCFLFICCICAFRLRTNLFFVYMNTDHNLQF